MIDDYLGDMIPVLRPVMMSIEDQVMNKRDKGLIPACVSKWRIKSSKSLYLKTKIKKIKNIEELVEIKDVAGMRFLVLFEDDLISLHTVLLDVFLDPKKGLCLKEFKLFNWNDRIKEENFLKIIEEKELKYKKSMEEIGPVYKYLPMNPDSGYRSIHYLYEHKGGGYYIEVQLRTYLQDVWGELEHSLVYKQGQINPFIRESFVRLAEELTIKDSNIQYLNQLSKKERRYNNSVKKHESICPYISHNKPLLSKKSFNSKKYTEYADHAKKYPIGATNDKKNKWIENGEELLDELYKAVDSDSEDKKYLWYSTEKAYWVFRKGDYIEARKYYESALDIRERIKDKVKWGYSINLRLGETYVAEGEYTKAWVEFDKAELQVPNNFKGDEVNVFELKKLLAYQYWVFGSEMYELALEKMLDAKKIYEKNKKSFVCEVNKDKNVRAIKNNLCWYQLEVCVKAYQRIKKYTGADGDEKEKISEKEIRKFDKLKKTTRKYLNDLVDILNEVDSSNGFDTVAWTYYNMYLIDRNDEDLMKAYSYAEEMLNKKVNNSKQIEISSALQKAHLQEIVNEMSERGLT